MALAKVNGVFRLSKDIELLYLPSGAALAKVSVVNSSKYKTQSGEQKEESCFIDGVIFGKLAEVANQYLKKGSKVYIDAELKQETWTAQDGTNRSKHSLKINSFEMLDSKQDSNSNNNQTNQQGNYNQNPPVHYEQQAPDIDIDESEILF